MAWVSPSTRTTGTLITASIWNADVVENPTVLRAGGMAIASQAANDVIYASSATQLARSATWPTAIGAQLRQTFRGVHLRTSPNADAAATTVALLHADEIVCSDGQRRTPADNLSAVITTAGIGGLRSGQSEAASTWYKVLYCYGSSGEGIYLEQAKDWLNDEEQTGGVAVVQLRRATGDIQTKLAQGFDTDTTGYIDFVDIKISQSGSPTGRAWLTLEANSSGDPSGTPLATSMKFDVAKVATSGQWVRVPFYAPVSLTAATTYHLVLQGDYTASDTDGINWIMNSAGAYAAGHARWYNGSVWAGVAGGTAYDATFKIYVRRNDNAVSPPSGYDTGYAHIGWVFNNSASDFEQFVAYDRNVRVLENAGSDVDTTAIIMTLTDYLTVLPPVRAIVDVRGYNSAAGNVNTISSVPNGFDDKDGTNGAAGQVVLTGPGASYYAAHGEGWTDFQAVYLRVTAGTGRFQPVGYRW